MATDAAEDAEKTNGGHPPAVTVFAATADGPQVQGAPAAAVGSRLSQISLGDSSAKKEESRRFENMSRLPPTAVLPLLAVLSGWYSLSGKICSVRLRVVVSAVGISAATIRGRAALTSSQRAELRSRLVSTAMSYRLLLPLSVVTDIAVEFSFKQRQAVPLTNYHSTTASRARQYCIDTVETLCVLQPSLAVELQVTDTDSKRVIVVQPVPGAPHRTKELTLAAIAEARAVRLSRSCVGTKTATSCAKVGSRAAWVQCRMHWRSETQGDKEQESILYVLSEAELTSNSTDTVERAFAVIGQRWKREFGISVTLKDPGAIGHLVYSLKIPDHTSEDSSNNPAQGLLFIALQLPHVKGVGSNIALQQATEKAVGHVVAQFAAADCVFLTRQRQKRRRHAPGIAQRLARMLCRIGDERTLFSTADAIEVELDEEDVKQIHDVAQAGGLAAGAGTEAAATCLKVQTLLADGECGRNTTSRRFSLLFTALAGIVD